MYGQINTYIYTNSPINSPISKLITTRINVCLSHQDMKGKQPIARSYCGMNTQIHQLNLLVEVSLINGTAVAIVAMINVMSRKGRMERIVKRLELSMLLYLLYIVMILFIVYRDDCCCWDRYNSWTILVVFILVVDYQCYFCFPFQDINMYVPAVLYLYFYTLYFVFC